MKGRLQIIIGARGGAKPDHRHKDLCGVAVIWHVISHTQLDAQPILTPRRQRQRAPYVRGQISYPLLSYERSLPMKPQPFALQRSKE